MTQDIKLKIVKSIPNINQAKNLIIKLQDKPDNVVKELLKILKQNDYKTSIYNIVSDELILKYRSISQIKELVNLYITSKFKKSVYAIIKNEDYLKDSFKYQYVMAKASYVYQKNTNLEQIQRLLTHYYKLAYEDFNLFDSYINKINFELIDNELMHIINFILNNNTNAQLDCLEFMKKLTKENSPKKIDKVKRILTNQYPNNPDYKAALKAVDWYLNDEVPYKYLINEDIISAGTCKKELINLYIEENEKVDKNNLYYLIFHSNIYKYRNVEELRGLINIYKLSNYNLCIRALIESKSILKYRTYEKQIELINIYKKNFELINGNKDFEYRVVAILTNKNLLKNQNNIEINELLEKFSKLNYYKRPYDIIKNKELPFSKKLDLLDYEINKTYYQKALNNFKAINDKETLINYLENIQEEINKANKNHELINPLVKRRNKK